MNSTVIVDVYDEASGRFVSSLQLPNRVQQFCDRFNADTPTLHAVPRDPESSLDGEVVIEIPVDDDRGVETIRYQDPIVVFCKMLEAEGHRPRIKSRGSFAPKYHKREQIGCEKEPQPIGGTPRKHKPRRTAVQVRDPHGAVVSETIFEDQAAKLCNEFNARHKDDPLEATLVHLD